MENGEMGIRKVLVIDDEEDIREIIKIHLGNNNVQVLEADNGEEAINLLRDQAPGINVGLILCDIRMPKVNGFECVDYIKKQAPGIPVVIITGYPDMEMAKNFLAKGVKDFLVKPVEKKNLLETVERFIACNNRAGC
jgi:DNA-binding NtrC family response regulator